MAFEKLGKYAPIERYRAANTPRYTYPVMHRERPEVVESGPSASGRSDGVSSPFGKRVAQKINIRSAGIK